MFNTIIIACGALVVAGLLVLNAYLQDKHLQELAKIEEKVSSIQYPCK